MPKKLTAQERFNRAAATLIRRIDEKFYLREVRTLNGFVPQGMFAKAMNALVELEFELEK